MENLVRLRKLMSQKSVDGLAIVPGPNLAYLTGSEFHLSERPVVLFVQQENAMFVLPELESPKIAGLDIDYISYDVKPEELVNVRYSMYPLKPEEVDNVREWASDLDKLAMSMPRLEGMSGVLSSELLRVLQILALESNLLAVSSKEGEGMDDLYSLIQSTFAGGDDLEAHVDTN